MKGVIVVGLLAATVPATAKDVSVGVMNRARVIEACQEQERWVALGVTDPTNDAMPESGRAKAILDFSICDSIVDLNALVGGEPTNAQIITAINTVVTAYREWRQNGTEHPDPAGFTFSKTNLPGDVTSAEACGITADTLCGLVQTVPAKRSATAKLGTGFCAVRCELDPVEGQEENDHLWSLIQAP